MILKQKFHHPICRQKRKNFQYLIIFALALFTLGCAASRGQAELGDTATYYSTIQPSAIFPLKGGSKRLNEINRGDLVDLDLVNGTKVRLIVTEVSETALFGESVDLKLRDSEINFKNESSLNRTIEINNLIRVRVYKLKSPVEDWTPNESALYLSKEDIRQSTIESFIYCLGFGFIPDYGPVMCGAALIYFVMSID